jgi:hypothetical protein
MNDFELYLGEILHIYGQEDPGEKDRSQELLGIVSKQYKHIEWTAQPFADEYMPPAEGGEHDIEEHSEEMTPIDLIAHYLNEIFFHYKTKEEAEAMVKVRFELRLCRRRVARQIGALQLLFSRGVALPPCSSWTRWRPAPRPSTSGWRRRRRSVWPHSPKSSTRRSSASRGRGYRSKGPT